MPSRNSNNKNIIGCKGQALLEYGVILGLVVTALISMQLYVQRSLQARYKGATDYAIKEISGARKQGRTPLQYEPYYHQSDITTEANSDVEHSYLPEGSSATSVEEDTSMRYGTRVEHPFYDGVE